MPQPIPEFRFLSESIAKVGDFGGRLSSLAVRAGINLPNIDDKTRQEIAAQALIVLNNTETAKLEKLLAMAGMMSPASPVPKPTQKR